MQSIYPVEDRLMLFQYIEEQPIVMNLYNHTISYSTMGTVVAGILAACCCPCRGTGVRRQAAEATPVFG